MAVAHVASFAAESPGADPPALQVTGLGRTFGSTVALSDVSFTVDRGEVHAILGPNGAGKTTLLRALVGTVVSDGQIAVLGAVRGRRPSRGDRRHIGLVPSGDRSFYLRISGLENLVFFARLHGMSRREALQRARNCLAAVDLVAAAGVPVMSYSHGMQRRLAVARAILTDPVVLLVDEATHDLDPLAAHRVRALVRERAGSGAAVVWATQRLDEIRGFADRVTVLHRGSVRFQGTVRELLGREAVTEYVLVLRDAGRPAGEVGERAQRTLGARATIAADAADRTGRVTCQLALHDGTTVGEAIADLVTARFEVLTCHEARSGLEAAFVALTRDHGA